MGEPEFSLLLKMMVKGSDATRLARRLLWLLITALVLVIVLSGLPRLLWPALLHYFWQ